MVGESKIAALMWSPVGTRAMDRVDVMQRDIAWIQSQNFFGILIGGGGID